MTHSKGLSVTTKKQGSVLLITLSGRIDTDTAPTAQQQVADGLEDCNRVVIDCTDLEYISSSGLRVILYLRKRIRDVEMINVSSAIFEILQTTGFTEMIEVRRPLRHISTEGCEVIGEGAMGIVYRIDRETIVKEFKDPEALRDIENEQALARKAFILGVPTAIPYDIVITDHGLYGSVFELLEASSFQKLILTKKKTLSEVAEMSAELLHVIHGIELKEGDLPSCRSQALDLLETGKELFTDEEFGRLKELYEGIPECNRMIHGDFHIKNVMVRGEEPLLIDMEFLSSGDPAFEFSGLYVAYHCFSELFPGNSEEFFKINDTETERLFMETFDAYLEDYDKDRDQLLKQVQLMAWMRFVLYVHTGKYFKDTDTGWIREQALTHIRELMPQVNELAMNMEA